MKYEYAIKSIQGTMLEEGVVNALTQFRACLKLEKRFKEDVLKRGVKLAVSLTRKGQCVYTQRYETRRDFRRARLAEFRRRILRENGGVNVLSFWYVVMGHDGNLVLTRLYTDFSKPTWLSKRRKELVGPFSNEGEARLFVDQFTSSVDTLDRMDFDLLENLIGGSNGRARKKWQLYPRNVVARA